MKVKILNLSLATISINMLIGCASTGIVPLDQDSYLVAKKDGAPGIGVSYTVKAEVYQEAREFCNKQNKDVKTLSIKTIPAAPGRLGSSELIFKCVKKGETAELSPSDIKEIRYR